jgi:hypothetical protein
MRKTAADQWQDRCDKVAAESKDLAMEILEYLEEIDNLTAIDALYRAMSGTIYEGWPPETRGAAIEHYITALREHFAYACKLLDRVRN